MVYIIGHKNPDTDTICSCLAYEDYLKRHNIKAKAVSLGKINKETNFVLRYFKAKKPRLVNKLPHKTEIILLDHNEEEHSINNLNDLDIIEIIDHHRIKIVTDKPIHIFTKPLGSTCTIIAEKYFQTNTYLTRKIAGLLIAGIISDTLFFKSPTTTKTDIELVKKLNKKAKIKNLALFSQQMFKAKSNINGLKTEDLILSDYKKFNFRCGDCGIGVLETLNPDEVLKFSDKIFSSLRKIAKQKKLKGLFFVVIDIINHRSFVFYSNDQIKDMFKRLFNSRENQDGVLIADNLVSRKKQIVPVLEQ